MAGPATPGRVDWRAHRWAPFVERIGVKGAVLSDATLAMQIRLYPDAPGSPLVDLATVVSTAQGLSVITATSGKLTISVIQTRTNETTIEALPPFPSNGTEPGQPVVLAWDMLVSGGGYTKARGSRAAPSSSFRGRRRH